MTKNSLTETQQKILDLQGKVVLKACPGSGKTFVVANKILQEMKTWKHKNSGIAVLSFTNVASNELEKQICKISGEDKIQYPHYMGTLDSFVSQNIFMPFGHLIMKCKKRPTIIQEPSVGVNLYAGRIWRAECYDNGCKHMDFYFDKDRVLRNMKKDITDCPCTSRKPCLQLKNYCYKSGYATYADMNSIAIRILLDYPQIGKLLASKYPYIFIDEAQDTSSEQMEIVKLLVEGGGQNTMLIGDPDQAIYEWRDADPTVFMDIYNDENWNSELLNENFRCSQFICNATKIFSSLPKTSNAIGETKNHQYRPSIIKYDVHNKEELIDKFLNICNEQDIEVNEENVAILVRGKSGLMGTDYSQIKDLWQSPLAKMFSEASFAKENKQVRKTVDIIERALYYIFVDTQSNSIEQEKIDTIFNRDYWDSMKFELSMLLPTASISLRQWKVEITDLLGTFLEKHHFERVGEIEIKTKSRTTDKKLKDFLEQPIHSFYAKSYNMGYLNTTIHSVKGCTFEAVLLIIGQHGKLTSNILNTQEIDSEAIRTAYVAMTRARKVLLVAVPSTIKDKTLVRFSKEDWDYI